MNAKDFSKFEEILARTSPGVSQGVKFRFIGDMLADRGVNDALTLAILNTIKTHKIPYEILLSNHDVWFLMHFDATSGLNAQMMSDFITKDDAISIKRFYRFLSKTPDLREKFTAIIRTAYLPHLKLLSYSSGQKGVSRLAVYSHAPISFSLPGLRGVAAPDDTLAGLWQFYHQPSTNLPFKPTVENLPGMIDELNAKFQSSLQLGKPPSWKDIELADRGQPLFCFFQLIWQRPGKSGYPFDFEDFRQEYPEITFVHGHDMTSAGLPNVENIDNIFGKGGAENFRSPFESYKIFTVSPPVSP